MKPTFSIYKTTEEVIGASTKETAVKVFFEEINDAILDGHKIGGLKVQVDDSKVDLFAIIVDKQDEQVFVLNCCKSLSTVDMGDYL